MRSSTHSIAAVLVLRSSTHASAWSGMPSKWVL